MAEKYRSHGFLAYFGSNITIEVLVTKTILSKEDLKGMSLLEWFSFIENLHIF